MVVILYGYHAQGLVWLSFLAMSDVLCSKTLTLSYALAYTSKDLSLSFSLGYVRNRRVCLLGGIVEKTSSAYHF